MGAHGFAPGAVTGQSFQSADCGNLLNSAGRQILNKFFPTISAEGSDEDGNAMVFTVTRSQTNLTPLTE